MRKQSKLRKVKTKLDKMIVTTQDETNIQSCQNHLRIENSQDDLAPNDQDQDDDSSCKRHGKDDDEEEKSKQIAELTNYRQLKNKDLKTAIKLYFKVKDMQDNNNQCKQLLDLVGYTEDELEKEHRLEKILSQGT